MKELKQIRKDLGLTQMELACLVGVSVVSIRMWEGGASAPNEENKQKLDEVLSKRKQERSK